MNPFLLAVFGYNPAINREAFHLVNGVVPFIGDPLLIRLQHIVKPLGGQAVHQADTEDFLVTCIGIQTAAVFIGFKNPEIDGFGDEPETFLTFF